MLLRLAHPSNARSASALVRKRRGVTIVESALVLSVFLMLLFGMFEYCRFLYTLHVTNNAAREAARYASVNVNCSGTSVATTQAAVVAYAKTKMGMAYLNLSGYNAAVYSVDPTGLTLSPPVIRAATSSTASPAVYPDPFNSSDPNAVAWNSSSFPNRIAVSIKGTYVPVLPTLLIMPSSIPIYVTAMCGAED
jgi:Flp pilus assembly protein TadG